MNKKSKTKKSNNLKDDLTTKPSSLLDKQFYELLDTLIERHSFTPYLRDEVEVSQKSMEALEKLDELDLKMRAIDHLDPFITPHMKAKKGSLKKEVTKLKLSIEPKRRMTLPKDANIPKAKGTQMGYVAANGYAMDYPLGEEILVPHSFALQLAYTNDLKYGWMENEPSYDRHAEEDREKTKMDFDLDRIK